MVFLLTSTSSIGSSLINMIQMIFFAIVFIAILFLAYYSTRIVAGAKLKNMKNNNMEVIESISIGLNQVHIIKANKQYFLISTSKDGIRMLSEIQKDGLIINENTNNIQKIPFEKYFKANMKKGEKDDK